MTPRQTPYSLTGFEAGLDALAARIPGGAPDPAAQHAFAMEARQTFEMLLAADAPDWNPSDAWSALYAGPSLIVAGPQAMITASAGAAGVAGLHVETPEITCEIDYRPDSCTVRITEGARTVSHYTFGLDGSVRDERDWESKIREAQEGWQAGFEGVEPGGGDDPPTFTPPAAPPPGTAPGGGIGAGAMLKGAGIAGGLAAAGLLAAQVLQKRAAAPRPPAPPPAPPPPPPPVATPKPEKQWYYTQEGQTLGPLAEAELRRRLDQLGPDTLVWTEGLAAWQTASAAGLARPPSPAALELYARSGPERGNRYPLAGPMRIGRSAECEVRLADNRASRVHAVLERRADGMWIADNGSLNGTFVNGARIAQPVRLSPGDAVTICENEFVVQPAAGDAPAFDPDRTIVAPVARPPSGTMPVARACPRCGNLNGPQLNFCEQCGQKLR